MQEQQIKQLEHHAAQLEDTLKAGGIISASVTSTEGSAAGGAEEGVAIGGVLGEDEDLSPKGDQGADGDLP